MKSSVKVIKGGRNSGVSELKSNSEEKTVRESTREIVSTVKGWIGELEKRHRAEQRAAYSALIR
jgi:hypothetical protein